MPLSQILSSPFRAVHASLSDSVVRFERSEILQSGLGLFLGFCSTFRAVRASFPDSLVRVEGFTPLCQIL